MNFVSAKIRLFRIYSIVLAITGAFVLNCALGQPVSSDEAKTANRESKHSLALIS